MNLNDLKPGIIVRGPMLPEPVEVLVVTPLGEVVKLTGAGQKTGQVHQRVLHAQQLALLEATPETEPFDGDPLHFKLGVEAARLGLAYEYDPYFSLSIARVDPLPHQLEAQTALAKKGYAPRRRQNRQGAPSPGAHTKGRENRFPGRNPGELATWIQTTGGPPHRGSSGDVLPVDEDCRRSVTSRVYGGVTSGDIMLYPRRRQPRDGQGSRELLACRGHVGATGEVE